MWHENGQKKWEIYLKDGKQHGMSVSWYKNGQKRREGNRIEHKNDGLWVYWDENGKKIKEETWDHGKLLETASELKRVDERTLIYKDGIHYEEGSDKPFTGIAFVLHDDGLKLYEGNYEDGKRTGTFVSWNKNGQKDTETDYKNGKQHGPMIIWDENGNINAVFLFNEGELVTK